MSDNTEHTDPEPDTAAAKEGEDAVQDNREVDPEATEEPASADEDVQEDVDPEVAITALEEEVTELKDRLLRAVAETANVRRRAQRDKEDMAKYAISNFSRDMLAIADNLRRALDSIDEDTRKNNGSVENLLIGVEMTERELLATFKRTGIKRMEPMGQRFDPNVHEAMFEYEDKDHPDGCIGQVIEPGYMLHSRTLRPAKVGVTRGGPKPDAKPGAEAKAPPADTKAYENQPDSTDDQVGEHINEEF